MKQIIYTDCHELATNLIKTDVLTVAAASNVRLIGDIIDGANCKKSDVNKAIDLINILKLRHGDNYIFGNHERQGMPAPCYIKLENAVLAHGDLEANFQKWLEYRNKAMGASFFKRGVIVNAIEAAEKIINRKPKEDFLNRAANIAKYHGVKTYVCGHFHPDEKIEVEHKGYRIIILPRGRNEIEL